LNKLLRVLVALPALLFVVIGLRWIIQPEAAAASLGMPLLEGIARSSQMGDLAVCFLSIGAMIFIALITGKRRWFYVPALMLITVAIVRILAWLLHDAALAGQMIAVEVIVACLLLFASSTKIAED